MVKTVDLFYKLFGDKADLSFYRDVQNRDKVYLKQHVDNDTTRILDLDNASYICDWIFSYNDGARDLKSISYGLKEVGAVVKFDQDIPEVKVAKRVT